MRLKVRVPADDVRSALKRARVLFATQQRDALETMGVRILSFSRQSYVTKSRGGTGMDGIKWAALSEQTVKRKSNKGAAKKQKNRAATKSGKARPTGNATAIGIDTGLQINSASPGFKAQGGGNIMRLTNTDIEVGYGRSYSEHFDKRRPLMPETLPDKWRQACEEIVARWAERLIKEAIGDGG